MTGGAEMLQAEEIGLVQVVDFDAEVGERVPPKAWKKSLLVVACCLLCTCVLGVPTAFLFMGNGKGAEEGDTSILIENRSLPQVAAHHQHSAVKPRAHLTVAQDKWQETSKDFVHWEDKLSMAFSRGMTYREPFLEITVTGDYYIYAQVTFKHVHPCREASKSIQLSINRKSDRYDVPEELISSTKSVVSKCPWSQPIYLGAVVNLEQRDQLVVNASHLKMVDIKTEHKTFFGAFLL
ncbi:tumor necrosis factor ligand superfamily member 15 [Ambystoma mexicanum]|uniref:tumor necrosis factor ligand superfamily member 15 n=1 Tax=Ambystoma mexicanum TaxID=8296 RepID=UPI0037E9737B